MLSCRSYKAFWQNSEYIMTCFTQIGFQCKKKQKENAISRFEPQGTLIYLKAVLWAHCYCESPEKHINLALFLAGVHTHIEIAQTVRTTFLTTASYSLPRKQLTWILILVEASKNNHKFQGMVHRSIIKTGWGTASRSLEILKEFTKSPTMVKIRMKTD